MNKGRTWGHSASTAEERAARRKHQRSVTNLRRKEGRGLVIASVLVMIGLVLTYWAKSSPFSETNALLESKEMTNLTTVEDASDLLPHLNIVADTSRRRQMAGRLAAYLRGAIDTRGNPLEGGARPALPNVGRLATVRAEDGNQVLTSREFRTLKPAFVVRTPGGFRGLVFGYALLFFLGFYLVHGIWRIVRPRTRWGPFTGDPTLLPAMLLLTGIGFMMMVSLRDPLRDFTIFTDYVAGVFVGCVVLLVSSQFSYESLKKHWMLPLFASLGLFVVLQLFGSGPVGSGVKVNLRVPGIGSVQPAEMIKVLIVFFLAGYFANYGEYLREMDERRARIFKQLPVSIPRLELFLPVALAVVLTLGAFFVVKEMGTALVLSLSFFLLYGIVRKRAGLPVLGTLGVLVMFWIGYTLPLSRTIVNRIRMWLSPWDNEAFSGGEHLAQSFWAFASGGLTGTGLGRGDPSYVPESHTDMILSAVGEELGWIGLVVIGLLFLWVIQRIVRIALRADSAFKFFLALGLALILMVQILLISGGISAVFPLTGIVTPFLSYGKSSMILNFFVVGVVMSISAGHAHPEMWTKFARPIRWISLVLGGLFVFILLRIGAVQLFGTGHTLARGALVVQADGERRNVYNPRLIAFQNQLARGDIFDRNGILLATSRWENLDAHREAYDDLSVDLDAVTNRFHGRHYPFDALTFHLLGDIRGRPYWTASNTSFAERVYGSHLLGYEDHEELVEYLRSGWARRRFLERDRDLHLTLDIRLQKRAAEILEHHMGRTAAATAASAVLLDAETGDVLAAVSLPGRSALTGTPDDPNFFVDRVRFALRPPGSTFKIVTAMAAIRKDGNAHTIRLPCSEEDPSLTSMEDAVRRSCNEYFMTLATDEVGAEDLLTTAAVFGIETAQPNTPEHLRQGNRLEQAGFGQGEVTATPLEMAQVAAAVANDGEMPTARWTTLDEAQSTEVITRRQARRLGTYMRKVVIDGTARRLRTHAMPIAGKTGTAQIRGKPDHAWFISYAPAEGAGRKLACAVLIEHGGAGGQFAAPAAGDIIEAARNLGLFDQP